ncbi:MAG: outer membrane beta-barrel protein [Ignavibacteria bacterium]|nr:outer membrane beta-barrel protein [Ignavibacteria bacterium]
MKTRIFSLIMTLFLTGSIAFAQTTEKITFSALGGINFQNMNGTKVNGDKLTNDLILAYHAGINVQIPIAMQFYFQPGLMYATKGSKNTYSLLGASVTSTTKLAYIEMPLNLVYKAFLGNGYFMLGFGPYVAYGISGKVNTEGAFSLEQKVVFTNTVEVGDDISSVYYKAFDAGGNIFVAYEFAGGLFAQFDTQLGMVKINPEDNRIPNDQSSVKNTGFGLSLGYRF